jgi:hypothetical protein
VYNTGIAYFLWLVSGCGALGFHRFYLGKPVTAVLWMCTGGLGMVGSVYDFFTLSGQVREANIRLELRRALDLRDRRTLAPRLYYADEELASYRKKESLERTILRTAKKNGGIATASEVALEADSSIEEAQAALEKLASKGFAELRVRKSGALVYTFPEFMNDNSPFEDF